MMSRIYQLLVAAITIVSVTTAFAPTTTTTIGSKTNTAMTPHPIFTFQPAHVVMSTGSRLSKVTIRSLSSTEPESDTKETSDASTAVSADGTFYDDEVEPTVTKVGISESMKDRLTREASTGLDADKPQQNVILYIIAAVSILVLLGGKDIFY